MPENGVSFLTCWCPTTEKEPQLIYIYFPLARSTEAFDVACLDPTIYELVGWLVLAERLKNMGAINSFSDFNFLQCHMVGRDLQLTMQLVDLLACWSILQSVSSKFK